MTVHDTRTTHLPSDFARHTMSLPVRTDAVQIVTSESLFRGTKEIGIEHAGSFYRLKITRQGKLILNK